MDKICCIILNYNDAHTTLALAGELSGSRCLSDILVVDNHSSDDSWEQLAVLKANRTSRGKQQNGGPEEKGPAVHLIRTGHNGGYGAGNQAGIDYAMEHLSPDYIIIANPDIHVSDACILRVKEALARQENAAAASALVRSPEGKRLFSYWDLLPMWKDLLDTEPFCRRIFKPWLITPAGRLPRGADGRSRVVGALPGSFFMLKPGLLTPQDIEGLFDSRIFLYYEEKVLGRKFQEMGLKTVLVTDESYVHAHSATIDKSLKRMVDKQRLLHQSKLYYYREYLHAGPALMAAAGVALDIILAEVWFLTVVCRMRW